MNWSGSIDACLTSGEYDQGDYCLVEYDALYDLRAERDRALHALAAHRAHCPEHAGGDK